MNSLKQPTKLAFQKDLRLLKDALLKDFKEADPNDIEEIIKQTVEERVQQSVKNLKPLEDEIDCLRREVAARDDRLNFINSLRTAITCTESFLKSGTKFYEDRMINSWRNYFVPESECFNFSNGDTIHVRAQKVLNDLQQDFRNSSI